ncbi:MAG: class I SAM-dependent methyltransferase [Candidatus Woesearchaeota archaeon]
MDHRFIEIKAHFDHVDLENIKKGVHGWKDTPYGIWGHSTLTKVHDLFKRLPLKKDDVFLDLGSGDGRIAILASEFCKAYGVEGDKPLHEEAQEHVKALKSNAKLLNEDFFKMDLSKYTILFTFYDKRFPLEFEEKLSKFNGILLNYSDIFKPARLQHENILWLDQTPCFVYKLPQKLKKLPADDLGLS